MTCLKKPFALFLCAFSFSAFADDCIFNPEEVVSFCTENNELGISYPAGTDGEDVFPFGIGCLGNAPSGAWYAMQIEEPGKLAIKIAHSEGKDVDFACFGPFKGDSKMDMLKSVCANSSSFDVPYVDDSQDDAYYWDYDADTLFYNKDCISKEFVEAYTKYHKGLSDYETILFQLEEEASNLYEAQYGALDYADEAEAWADYYDFIDAYVDSHSDQLPTYPDKPDDPTVYNIDNPCFRGNQNFYPAGTMVDCSYSSSSQEICYVPNAKHGEWYLLLITNYSQEPGTISFYKQSGAATTNCSIIVDASCNGPYCEGDDIKLTVNNAPDGATFLWSGPNGFSSTLCSPSIPNCTKKDAGAYSVVMYANGLESPEVEVKVEVSKPDTTTLSASIVEGESYYFGGKNLKAEGSYSDVFQNEGGCDSLVVLNLTVTDKPEEPVEPEVEPVEPVEPEVEPVEPEVEPVAPEEPVEPVVPEPQDSIKPSVNKRIVPAVALTPNGDGINDVWTILNIDQYPDAVVSIYDRYGKKLYSVKDYNNLNGWNGTYNGNPMPTADYWYLIDIESIDAQFTGHFTLMR